MDYASDQIYRHGVVPVGGDYNIGEFLGGLNELLVHWLQSGLVSIQYLFQIAASRGDVAFQAAYQPFIAIGVHEYFYVEQFTDIWIRQYQNSLNNDNLFWECGDCFPRSVVLHKGIDGLFKGISVSKFLQMVHKQIKINGIWVVEIYFYAFVIRQFTGIVVIRILRNNANLSRREFFYNLVHHGCLSASGAAGNADYEHSLLVFYKCREKVSSSTLRQAQGDIFDFDFDFDFVLDFFPIFEVIKFKMKTILLHPSYFPSIEQMAVVAQAEKVVFEIQDNYQKQTYRNRAFIAHSNGKLLLNIPIKHTKTGKRQKTKDVIVENDFPWQEQHWKSLQSAYRTSPFFEYYEDDFEHLFTEPVKSLLEHNLKIFDLLCELIGIDVEISKTVSFETKPEITDLRFLIDAKRKTYFNPETYSQVHEANHSFLPNLSVLDLLFNEGPNALSYLDRQTFQVEKS